MARSRTKKPFDLEGLSPTDLRFKTLPAEGYNGYLDFMLMSCHNPELSQDDGCNGFAVWSRMPKIIEENKNIRFAIMAGDQIYADRIVDAVRKEKDERKRQELYLGVYRDFWSDLNYRRILCECLL